MKKTLLATCLLLAQAIPAASHPHVWIKATSTALLDAQGRVTAIRNTWTMDEDYSAMATEGLDKDGDGKLSPQELEPLSRENLEALKEFEFFTYAYENGTKVPPAGAGNASQLMSEGKLTLTFDVTLSRPLDPVKGAVTWRVYDPSFYIDIAVESTQLAGAPPSCRTQAEAPVQDEQALNVQAMLADKPPDWQPPVEQDFGALFADTITVTCAS